MIFQEKDFSCYILLTDENLIARLPLLLEILVYMCITIVCSCYDVINFEISLIFLIKQFFYMTKMSRQKSDILRTKRTFKMKWKHFSLFLKGFFSCQKLSQTWECTFKDLFSKCEQIRNFLDLVTFTEEILNEKLRMNMHMKYTQHFQSSEKIKI